MEDKIITTSGGYKVIFNPFLTYDQFIEIQKFWFKDVLINPNETDEKGNLKRPELTKLSPNAIYDANKIAVGFLVKSILDPKGQELKRDDKNSLPIPPIDGEEIMEIISAISKEAADAFGKKKVIA